MNCVATGVKLRFSVRSFGCALFIFKKMGEAITLSDQHCKDCKYYLQHYTFIERKISRIQCGHCTLYPTRTKKPYAAVCQNFAPGTPQEDAFVSKEYLSKELLQYMLQLDLLPEITEANEALASILIKKKKKREAHTKRH